MEARRWSPSGFVALRLQRQSSRGSRGVERRGSRAEVSRPFGVFGTEALESKCRSEVDLLRGFGLQRVMVWPVSSGPQGRALRGLVRRTGAGHHRGSRAGTGKARKARAGRRSRRRERQVLVRERAGGELIGSAAALASSKEREVNVTSVRTWGTRCGGPGSTWRSKKPDEGSDRGRGLTAEPPIRDSAWRNASKSRRVVCGSRFVGERIAGQRQGGSSSRRGRVAAQSGEAPERAASWTRLRDETSPQASERSKPSRG